MRKFHLIGKLVFALACLFGFSTSAMAETKTFMENWPYNDAMRNMSNDNDDALWYMAGRSGGSIYVSKATSQSQARLMFGDCQANYVMTSPKLEVPGPGTITFTFKAGSKTQDMMPHWTAVIGTDREALTTPMSGTLKRLDAIDYDTQVYWDFVEASTVTAEVDAAGDYYVGLRLIDGCAAGYNIGCVTITWEGEVAGGGGDPEPQPITFFENVPSSIGNTEGFTSDVPYFDAQSRGQILLTASLGNGGSYMATPSITTPAYGKITYEFTWGSNTSGGQKADVYIGTSIEDATQKMNTEPIVSKGVYMQPAKNESLSIDMPAGTYYIVIKFDTTQSGLSTFGFKNVTCKWEPLDEPEPEPDVYTVIGAFNGWNESTEVELTEWSAMPGTYHATIENFTTEFKIRKNHSWDGAYGLADNQNFIAMRNQTALTAGGKNIALYPNIKKIASATLMFDPATGTLTVAGVEETADWNVMGIDADWVTGLKLEEKVADSGEFTATVDKLMIPAEGFKLRLGNDWDIQFGASKTGEDANALTVGTAYQMESYDNVPNIKIANDATYIKDAEFVFNGFTRTLTLNGTPVKVTALKLDKAEAKLVEGKTETLVATFEPAEAEGEFTWTSSDEEVATVADGVVTAVKAGTATITVAAYGLTATCEVTVVEPTTVVLNKSELALEVGQEETLEATVAPDAEAKVTWTSSDEAVATVDENGKVVAVAVGEATIKATCDDAEATCVVTVTEAAVVYTIALDKATAEVEEEKTITLVATLTPAKDDAVYTWTSSDEEVATVADGVVTGVKAGTATIKVEAEGVEATCEVTVLPKAGIDAIFADGAQYDVYTFDGVLVLRNADAAQFRALGAGMYIVGGRKYIVK